MDAGKLCYTHTTEVDEEGKAKVEETEEEEEEEKKEERQGVDYVLEVEKRNLGLRRQKQDFLVNIFSRYGVATISRLLEIVGLFCKKM